MIYLTEERVAILCTVQSCFSPLHTQPYDTICTNTVNMGQVENQHLGQLRNV